MAQCFILYTLTFINHRFPELHFKRPDSYGNTTDNRQLANLRSR